MKVVNTILKQGIFKATQRSVAEELGVGLHEVKDFDRCVLLALIDADLTTLYPVPEGQIRSRLLPEVMRTYIVLRAVETAEYEGLHSVNFSSVASRAGLSREHVRNVMGPDCLLEETVVMAMVLDVLPVLAQAIAMRLEIAKSIPEKQRSAALVSL